MRILNLSGKITFPTGAVMPLDILSATVEEGADGVLLPGAVLSAHYTLTAANEANQWRNKSAVGATVQLFLNGAAMGVFKVDSVNAREHSGTITLSGNDSIASELSGAFTNTQAFPCALKDLWAHLLEGTRYEWEGEIPNGDVILNAPPDLSGETLRSMAGLIAQAAGCFVRVNRAGKLEMVPCRGDSAATVTADDYFSLDDGFEQFGPIRAVNVIPYNEERTVRYGSETGEALEIGGNPLFCADNLDALSNGLLRETQGLKWERATIVWRGDPSFEVGMRLNLIDTLSQTHECVISGQTLRFENGFTSTVVCEIPRGDESGVPRTITPEGGVNAERLIGTVDGGLLRAGTVSARAIAARSITAQKIDSGAVNTEALAAGAVTAEKIAAGAVDAQSIHAISAHLENVVSRKMQTDALYAALIRAQTLAAQSITADSIQTDAFASALARVVSLAAGTGEFDSATVENLLSSALILQQGIADSMLITNLAVTSANLLNATVDKLVLKGSDGKYYHVFVGANGAISAQETTVTQAEIDAGQTADGRQITATTANVAELNAQTVKAKEAVIGTIVTESLTAGKITATEAVLASAVIPTIYTDTITALGNSLNLSANQSIIATVEGATDPISEAVGTAHGLAEAAQASANNAQTSANNAQATADALQEATATIQTQLIQTKDGLSVVQTTQSELDGRVKTLESGVHIEGAEIGIYTSDSPYRNTITNSGWEISEHGTPVITCAETKLTAPRVQITDALIIGITAWKPGTDKHLRLLKYGR